MEDEEHERDEEEENEEENLVKPEITEQLSLPTSTPYLRSRPSHPTTRLLPSCTAMGGRARRGSIGRNNKIIQPSSGFKQQFIKKFLNPRSKEDQSN